MSDNTIKTVQNGAHGPQWRSICVLALGLVIGIVCPTAHAAVSLLGVQFVDDNVFEEYSCIWHDQNYPPPCAPDYKGAHAHVFIKNDGPTQISITDVILGVYSLKTVLKYHLYNDHPSHSIYHYWNYPPTDITTNKGEPVWFKGDPSTIPPGGVGQAIIRLRWIPTDPSLTVGVVTTGGTINTTVPVNLNQPELASVGYSYDQTNIYLHWRRNTGGAPTTIRMDGVDVTADTVTVSDPSTNFAISKISLSSPVMETTYHVYQGIYSDGAMASVGTRTRIRPIMHGSWSTFEIPDGNTAAAAAWIDSCCDHGINAVIMQASSGLSDYLSTGAGRTHAAQCGYRAVIDYPGKFGVGDPMMWFLDDETDIEENTIMNNFCRDDKLFVPCNHDPTGIMGMHFIEEGEALRSVYNAPTTINMDGTYKPRNYYAYGQAVDSLMIDSYYQKRVMDSYYYESKLHTRELYKKATVIYATCRAGTTASEPNPFNILLFSCEANPSCCPAWPFAMPQTKRTEVYYALAGGAKGIGYWWFKAGNPSNGLGDQADPRARALWKEIGLLGNEIKTVQPLLARGCPVDLDVQGSTYVWVRALAVDIDSFILFVVNDNHWNDQDWHATNVPNATVTINLPAWMQSGTPSAFEVSPSGLGNVTTQLNGDQFQMNIGTLAVARMFVVTTNPALRAMIQQRYEEEVWPGVCNIAPEHCTPQENPPTITMQPSSQEVIEGDSVDITIMAAGTNPLSYQWQKNQINLSNGGHYAGCNTATLTIDNTDSSDVANYRCVVTNLFGSATSNEAALTLAPPGSPIIKIQPVNQQVIEGGAADFTVKAIGTSPLSYQWQKNLVNLSNGGHYAGVTTPTLTVSNADATDQANYRCVVTNSYGSANSDTVSLTVTVCTAPNLLNGSFENIGSEGLGADWAGYTRHQDPATVEYSQQIDMTIDGLLCQEILTSYVATGGAGVYQTITGCISDAAYNISGWMKTDSTNCRATVRCAVNGSTSYEDAINLYPPVTSTSTSWVPFSGVVVATGPNMTLFLDSQTYVNGSPNQSARFDGLTIACGTPPPVIPGDYDTDGDVDADDIDTFIACFSGPTIAYTGDCEKADFDEDNDVDLTDFGAIQRCYSDADILSDADCMN